MAVQREFLNEQSLKRKLCTFTTIPVFNYECYLGHDVDLGDSNRDIWMVTLFSCSLIGYIMPSPQRNLVDQSIKQERSSLDT